MIAPGKRADIVLLDDLEDLRGLGRDERGPPRRRRSVRDARHCRAGRSRQRQARACRGGRFPRLRHRSDDDAGDRRHSGQDHHRAFARHPAVRGWICDVRSRPGHRQGRGRRASRHQPQYRPRLRQGIRDEARRHRILGRARQPQHLRRRRRRCRHGAAVNRLRDLQGGFVVVADGEVLAELAAAHRGPDERSARSRMCAMRSIRCARPRGNSASRWPSRSSRSHSCRFPSSRISRSRISALSMSTP